MDTIQIDQIKQKTTHNLFFLSVRNFGLQAISTVGFFLLTLLLGTGEVGLFAIVAESVGILGYFSDIGLASALIQQKKTVTTKELRTTFTIQQLLVFILLIVAGCIYPSISQSKSYGNKEMWIFISLCYSFLVASLKTIPSVILERQLNFKIISTVDIIENITFYLVAVVFAFFNFGAYSYAVATFARSTLGLILIYRFSPWSIGIAFSFPSVKKLFRFGIPFQLNTFIALAKDRLSAIMVAGIIGRDAFGLLSWAQKGPRIPLSFMDAIMKVTFPTFSRLQGHPEILARSLQRSIYYIALFVFPALAGIWLISPDFINLIPKYGQWRPALTPLKFYVISYAIAAVTTPLTNAFNAIGKITTTTKFMIMWTILTWLFFPFFSYRYGYTGTAMASLLVSFSSFIVWLIAHRIFQINIFNTIIHPLLGTLIFFIPLSYLSTGNSLINLVTKVALAVIVYLTYNIIFARNQVNWFLSQLKWIKSPAVSS